VIEEPAIVNAVTGNTARVTPLRRASCGQCAAQGGCGVGALASYFGRRQPELLIENTLGVEAGDTVIIGLRDDALLAGSLLVYALPLGSMLAGAAIAAPLGAGVASDVLVLIGGGTGFGVGALAARWRLRCAALRQRVEPVMLRTSEDWDTVT